MSEEIGAFVVAKSLKSLGVHYVFGVVGIPVIEIAEACRVEGIQFIGMRNEQSASYAANAWGYLTGTPGVCLVVSGPGLVHALAGQSIQLGLFYSLQGLANAQANAWPMVLIAGSSDIDQESMGAFQEMSQVEATRLYTKYAVRPPSIEAIPFVLERSFRFASYGRPGCCYIDLPANFITSTTSVSSSAPLVYFSPLDPAPRPQADALAIEQALAVFQQAQKPLVIVGKGAGYSLRQHESILVRFLEVLGWPILPTPMGKGVVPDSHPLIASGARSMVLQNSDVVLVLGARLNWMLHFGKPPRWNKQVKFIKVDIMAEEMKDNVAAGSAAVLLQGDIRSVVQQLHAALLSNPSTLSAHKYSAWWQQVRSKIQKNASIQASLCASSQLPMNYYRAFHEIKQVLPKDIMLVSEGANTMDIGRTILDQEMPLSRLDAGSFGTMGVGFGFAIAAHLARPGRQCVCIQGDSAFGFSAMEYETVCRLRLPIVFIIINNNGIYSGITRDDWQAKCDEVVDVKRQIPGLPSTSLLPEAHYERLCDAFGGRGYFVKTPGELNRAVKDALASKSPCIINCIIEPTASRKPQEHSWLTRTGPKL